MNSVAISLLNTEQGDSYMGVSLYYYIYFRVSESFHYVNFLICGK